MPVHALALPEVQGLPDPIVWTAQLVTAVGECRRGARSWLQVYPMLDLQVLAQFWPQRRIRHRHAWHVTRIVGQSPSPGVWELTVLIREQLTHRAIAVRVEAAARSPLGHIGPPGVRYLPIRYLDPPRTAQAWVATAFALL